MTQHLLLLYHIVQFRAKFFSSVFCFVSSAFVAWLLLCSWCIDNLRKHNNREKKFKSSVSENNCMKWKRKREKLGYSHCNWFHRFALFWFWCNNNLITWLEETITNKRQNNFKVWVHWQNRKRMDRLMYANYHRNNKT